jgi:glycosyltransferase involved in cell wall biosynthesis
MAEMPRALMVAYHYPPCSGTSGVLRTLKFSRYLPDNGWQPIVLTTHPRAYETTRAEDAHTLPPSVIVKRSFALDAHRHLAIRGRTLSALALPDRWGSWWPGGVLDGLRLVRRYRPRVLWSTFPIATAHLIALTLHARTGLPWVADFRDPMTEEEYPPDPRVHRMYRWIEQRCGERASYLVFTAESARDMYLKRYPELTADRCLVISNGYDEEDYRDLPPAPGRQPGTPVRLLHSGMIYRSERDPRALFRAIARLKRGGQVGFRLELRAPGSEAYYRALIDELGIADIVRMLPSLPYRDALADAASADSLVLLQDASCNRQIPAKAYEYLRLGRPILALTSADGDTAALLHQTGGATLLDLRDEEAMAAGLPRFVDAVRAGTHALPATDVVRGFARGLQTQTLASLFARVSAKRGESPLARSR